MKLPLWLVETFKALIWLAARRFWISLTEKVQYKSVYVYIQTWEIEIFNLSRRLEKPESNLEAIDSKSLMNPFIILHSFPVRPSLFVRSIMSLIHNEYKLYGVIRYIFN